MISRRFKRFTGRPTAVVVAPTFSAAPVVLGIPSVGTAASFLSGSYNGTAPLVDSYRWRIDGVDVGSADTPYTPVTGDIGKSLSVRQTVTGPGGSASSTSTGQTVAEASSFVPSAKPVAGKAYIGGDIWWGDDKPTPFVDIVDSARGFGKVDGSNNPVWASVDDPTLARDADYWPTEACHNVISARTGSLADPNEITGTYKGFWEENGGASTMAVVFVTGATVTNMQALGGGLHTFDVVATGSFQLALRWAGGGVKNLRIITPGYSTVTPPLFRDDALNYYKQFHSLRGLNPLWLNDTWSQGDTSWATRLPANKRGGGRVSWENWIRIVNGITNAPGSKTKAIFVVQPYNADETYWTGVATLHKTLLHPRLEVWPTHDNEQWNGNYGFKYTQNFTTANNTGGPQYALLNNPVPAGDTTAQEFERGVRWWALRATHMSKAWQAVYPGEFGTRLRPVLESQYARWAFLRDVMLPWGDSAAMRALYGPINTNFYAIATAPYLSGDSAECNGAVDSTAMLTGLRTTFSGSLAQKTIVQNPDIEFELESNLRAQYGFAELITYEYNTHQNGFSNAAVEMATKLDPALKTLHKDALQALATAGYSRVNFLGLWAITYRNNDIHSLWGACQSFLPGDTTPGRLALQEKIAEWAIQ